jgi:hypothetical protein
VTVLADFDRAFFGLQRPGDTFQDNPYIYLWENPSSGDKYAPVSDLILKLPSDVLIYDRKVSRTIVGQTESWAAKLMYGELVSSSIALQCKIVC